MILGIDPSTYFEVLEKGPHYRYQGKEVEPLSLLHDQNGVTVMRIRLWVDPYDEKGTPYHGGTNDWPTFLRLAQLGMVLLLGIAYTPIFKVKTAMVPEANAHEN